MMCSYNSTVDLETRGNAQKGVGLHVDSVIDIRLSESLERPKGMFSPYYLPLDSPCQTAFTSVMPIPQQSSAGTKCNMSYLYL